MSDPMTEAMAKAIEIAIVEQTMHHPIAKYLVGLKWLWPHVARAARKAALEWIEGNVDEGMTQAACDATFGPEPMTPAEVHRLGLTAAIHHLSERSE